MHPTNKIFGDIWWCFDKYEIRKGNIIPSAGSMLRSYEPWSLYRAPSGKNTVQQPYHSLLNLLGDLGRTTEPVRPSNDLIEAILAWCGQYGLLGILLHRLEALTLPPRESQGNAVTVPTRYIRATSGWQMAPHIGSERMTPGAIVRRNLSGFELHRTKLSESGISRFFPKVSPKAWRDFPMPCSNRFWTLYSEPISDFIASAVLLRDAIEGAAHLPHKKPDLTADVVQSWQTSVVRLNGLTSPVRPTLWVDGTRQSIGWVCHSLIAAYALMATFDIARGRLLRCARPDCGIYFLTQSRAARYHSTVCRNTMQVRAYRERTRTEGEKDEK